MKNPINVRCGKNARASGAEFERRTRRDLEEKGWVVDKWSNNLESYQDTSLEYRYRLIPAKHKFRGMGIPMAMGTGFPDFIAFRQINGGMKKIEDGRYIESWYEPDLKLKEVIGVEVKTTGYLTQLEKEKCQWYLNKGIFSKILIARKEKEKNRIKIVYEDFNEKYR